MRFIKIGGIIVFALIITALGIDAADTLEGKSGTLLSQVIKTAEVSVCPLGMTEVPGAQSFTCVDTYEVAPKAECPHKEPKNIVETLENIQSGACGIESVESKSPWAFVTREQAMQLCARAGKRLPTAVEWYSASLGHVNADAACNVGGNSMQKTGASKECRAASGAYDMVGNAWEWVSDDVIDGIYNSRALPQTGYVSQVDNGGVATVSGESPDEAYESDYFWAKTEGAFGMIRGGFYGSGKDAGVYSVHADTEPRTAGAAIGFRCVR